MSTTLSRRVGFSSLSSCLLVLAFAGPIDGLFATGAVAQTAAVAGNWVQQAPAASPAARRLSVSAYDAATGTVVLFGGSGSTGGVDGGGYLADTWTWNGATWTQQTPATSPPARIDATMSYDAATGTLVLFGGTNSSGYLADTWTWNGTTWTQQSPATSPSARVFSTSAYDAATSTVVLFGGSNSSNTNLNDTWTWNGTTWTQQTPATSPSARFESTSAYDTATGTVVLFGGATSSGFLADTWTWNGTTWALQSPATSPSARNLSVSAYDAATGTVLLFSGYNGSYPADTWAWNGTTWAQQSPVTSPPGRAVSVMSYDGATGTLVLFGGYGANAIVGDTWTYSVGPFFAPSTNVGATAAQTPVSFNLTSTGTLGTTQVLTQGVTGLDFTLGSGSTCTGASTGACTINVAFAPTAPGLRPGAVNLTNSGGAVIATAYISGTGNAPLLTLGAGLISTVAGNGTAAFAGDGSAATSASLNAPLVAALDGAGNLYFSDQNNERVRKVTVSTGVISTVAGNGTAAFAGDGSAATAGSLNNPLGVAVDGAGNVYIADQSNHRIRKVTASTGVISTVAGNGTAGFAGDGGAATSASLNGPHVVTVDGAGNLYIADTGNHRVRQVAAGSGIISTVAGNGTATFAGDGGAATSASVNNPTGVAVDGSGNLYITDYSNNRVRKVTAGIISTVAGNGTAAFAGDGGAATSASINGPTFVVLDAGGDIFISDYLNNRIRKVTASSGFISTVAGNGTAGYSAGQDTGTTAATAASINTAYGVALDGLGNLYIPDTNNNRVRKVSVAGDIVFATATAAGTSDTTDGTQTAIVNNLGNLPLTFASQVETGSSFTLANPNTGGCSTAVPVAAGGSCLLGATFAPVAASSGIVTGSIGLTDNSLNVSGTQQNVLLLGATAANTVLVTVNSLGVVTGSASATISLTYGGSGSVGDTGTPSATVNGSAAGVGAISCKSKSSHQVCSFVYTGAALATPGNYPIVVSVSADSTYAAGSGSGTLRVSASGAVAPVGGPVQAGVVAVPVVLNERRVAMSDSVAGDYSVGQISTFAGASPAAENPADNANCPVTTGEPIVKGKPDSSEQRVCGK